MVDELQKLKEQIKSYERAVERLAMIAPQNNARKAILDSLYREVPEPQSKGR
jgi:hypothetical protein